MPQQQQMLMSRGMGMPRPPMPLNQQQQSFQGRYPLTGKPAMQQPLPSPPQQQWPRMPMHNSPGATSTGPMSPMINSPQQQLSPYPSYQQQQIRPEPNLNELNKQSPGDMSKNDGSPFSISDRQQQAQASTSSSNTNDLIDDFPVTDLGDDDTSLLFEGLDDFNLLDYVDETNVSRPSGKTSFFDELDEIADEPKERENEGKDNLFSQSEKQLNQEILPGSTSSRIPDDNDIFNSDLFGDDFLSLSSPNPMQISGPVQYQQQQQQQQQQQHQHQQQQHQQQQQPQQQQMVQAAQQHSVQLYQQQQQPQQPQQYAATQQQIWEQQQHQSFNPRIPNRMPMRMSMGPQQPQQQQQQRKYQIIV